jgi:recombination protein RecR
MSALPKALTDLIALLAKLPGIGPRSAERIALHLVQADPALSHQLAQGLTSARNLIKTCSVCGALAESDLCQTCNDPRRDTATLCVVERPVDIISLEKSGGFRGVYHVLGGKISPLDGVQPEDLSISGLERRLAEGAIKEVVLALGTDVEGDATSFYLAKRLAREGLMITRIAHGLPAGTGLDFADDLTLSRALEGRRELR